MSEIQCIRSDFLQCNDFSKVKSIVPITTRGFRVWEDEETGAMLFRFTWDYDGKIYTVPYQSVIHLKARFDRKRFLGSEPDPALKNTLELLDATDSLAESW